MKDRILVVEDDREVQELVETVLRRDGYEVQLASSAQEAREAIRSETVFSTLLLDIRLGGEDGLELCAEARSVRPDTPVVMMTGHGSIQTAIAALRSGAYDFLTKPLELDSLYAAIRRAVDHFSMTEEIRVLRRKVETSGSELGFVGESNAMKAVFDLIGRAAESNATVLVSGESGTGKELVARALHQRSGRSGNILAVNCAAMPANLLESELFGHVRGAFTDAKNSRSGLFVEANGGTLFLDEIGELDLEMQPKLLRALQEKRVRPVGTSKEVAFDTRIVAATNRNLEDEVKAGRFREDLYYRVNVINIHLPPLRSRGQDVLRLASHFMKRYVEESGRAISGMDKSVAERLLAHDWPGNVRELQNGMERAVALARHEVLMMEDLPPALQKSPKKRALIDTNDPDEMPSLDQLERSYVQRVLAATGDNKANAARVLGIDRRTLYRKLERWSEDSEPKDQ